MKKIVIGLYHLLSLAKKMKNTLAESKSEYTQLGQLTTYFKYAVGFAVATVIISSVALLLPEVNIGLAVVNTKTALLYDIANRIFSVLGIIIYSENLMFLALILRFMLNRQIWDE